jgi:hypothetical protein
MEVGRREEMGRWGEGRRWGDGEKGGDASMNIVTRCCGARYHVRSCSL